MLKHKFTKGVNSIKHSKNFHEWNSLGLLMYQIANPSTIAFVKRIQFYEINYEFWGNSSQRIYII